MFYFKHNSWCYLSNSWFKFNPLFPQSADIVIYTYEWRGGSLGKRWELFLIIILRNEFWLFIENKQPLWLMFCCNKDIQDGILNQNEFPIFFNHGKPCLWIVLWNFYLKSFPSEVLIHHTCSYQCHYYKIESIDKEEKENWLKIWTSAHVWTMHRRCLIKWEVKKKIVSFQFLL